MMPLGAAAAWRDGMRRVASAPALLAGVWLVTVASALPFAFAVRGLIQEHLGASLAADTAASGVNLDWMQEFMQQSSGLGSTVTPTVIGFGAVLDNLSAFLDDTRLPLALAAAAAGYTALWVFLAGGIIDRFARDRPSRAHAFFSMCGGFFFRFVRLGLLMLVLYGSVFVYLHPMLFERAYPALIRNVAVERTAFVLRLALYLAFGLVLAAVNLLFDYAKVRVVVEDRRSVVGAVWSAARFIGRNPGATTALYLLDVLLFAITIGVYAAVAPGAGRTGWTMWVAFAVSQLYIAARLWVKLAFWASEAALFQGRLAHAGYVARRATEWPESAAVDAIRVP